MDACRVKYCIWVLAAALTLGGLVSACGQKGDLYLPDRDTQQQGKR